MCKTNDGLSDIPLGHRFSGIKLKTKLEID